MENLKTIQGRIKEKRTAYTSSSLDYYSALQEWSLAQQGVKSGSGQNFSEQELDAKRITRDQSVKDLNASIDELAQGTPQELIKQLSSDRPFLLLPVRIETRYVTVRHVVRNLKTDDAVDVSKNDMFSRLLQNLGFEKDEEGEMTYRVHAFHLLNTAGSRLRRRLTTEELKPKSGKFIKRKDDQKELRIRMYPDEIFLEGFEKFLQPSEWDAGVLFWKNICGGKDQKEEWMRLSISATPARAAWIIRATKPANFSADKPLPAEPVFEEKKSLKDGAYTYPPITKILPDCFIVRLYKSGSFKEFTGKTIPEPLLLGLDPTNDPFDKDANSSMKDEGSSIQTPPYLRWMHDFEEAEKMGMAIRIDLAQHPEYADGVDKIVVTGIKLSADETDSAALLQEQLENHLYKEEGLSIIPKGTPTNNFGNEKAGFNQLEEFANLYFQSQWQPKKGGLAGDETALLQALGITNGLRIPFGHSTDLSEATLMNELLWPATWGYYLLQYFSPQLDEATREQARKFFLQYVSGRGNLPVLRVNRQPYGIIPVTSFSHLTYKQLNKPEESFASGLWTNILSKLDPLLQIIAQLIITTNDAASGLDANFFQMLGLSPSSAALKKQWVGGLQFQEVLKASQSNVEGNTALSSDAGFSPAARERELSGLGLNTALFNQLYGVYNTIPQQVRRILMDGTPISNERALEQIAGKAWNVLQWLSKGKLTDIWNNDTSAAPAGKGAELSSATISAFAVLVRQAVLRTSLENSLRVVEKNEGQWLLKVKDFEAQHLHSGPIKLDPKELSPTNVLHQFYKPIIDKFQLSEALELETDRRAYFEKKFPETGDLTLGDWLEKNKKTASVPQLRSVIRSLDYFSTQPTAKVQRLFTEHLDLCSHRFDAWMSALVYQRLKKQRKSKPQGIQIGAFGYLLGLKPNASPSIIFKEQAPEYLPVEEANTKLAAIPLIHSEASVANGIDPASASWNRAYFYIGNNPSPGLRLNTRTGHIEPDELINISHSDGFIHAPSMAHATAASILRAGYLNHVADNQTALLSIQLNSPRVRQALQLLEGMQQGASVGELLGYYFERLLHERKLDSVLYNLRVAFPLKRTEEGNKSASLMTTTDGMAILEARRQNPTNWLFNVPGINLTSHQFVINEVVQQLETYLDSLSDLLLAEMVYQTAKGNKDRAAAALRMMSSGGQAILPEFVKTPMKGYAITHRVGIVFEQEKGQAKIWTPAGSARSHISPDLNRWLSLQVPAPAQIAITVHLPDDKKEKLTVAEIGIEPIDLVYAMQPSFKGAGQTVLDLYVRQAAQKKFGADAVQSATFKIDYKERSLFTATEISIFEIGSLIASLKKMIADARSVTANDFLLPDKRAASAQLTDVKRIHASVSKLIVEGNEITATIQSLRKLSGEIDTAISQNKPEAELKAKLAQLGPVLTNAWQQGTSAEAIAGLSSDSAAQAGKKATEIASELEARLTTSRKIIAAIANGADGQTTFKNLQEAVAALFGSSIRIFPDISVENAKELEDCYKNRQLIENADADIVDAWLQEASLVRKPLQVYRRFDLLKELTAQSAVFDPTVLQFPFSVSSKQPWIGGRLTEDVANEQRGSLSLVLELPADFQTNKSISGFIIDEWPEWIPFKTVDTGVAFQFNQPNTEPPQTMLLAVAPVEGTTWEWEHLFGAVNDALELSKKRLLTPTHIRAGNMGLGHLLPAIALPFMPENKGTPVVEPL